MSIKRIRLSGFTLIELIVFIVIVSIGLAGVLAVFNTVVRGSADPLRQKQALAVAESMLEEIQLKSFANPSGGYVASCPATCDRSLFDDVADYNGYSRAGIADIGGTAVDGLQLYDITSVTVALSADFNSGSNPVAASACYKITVTVTDQVTKLSQVLIGYKFNND